MTQRALSALLGVVVKNFKRCLVNSSKELETPRNLRLKVLDRTEILETSNALVSVTVVKIHKERQLFPSSTAVVALHC